MEVVETEEVVATTVTVEATAADATSTTSTAPKQQKPKPAALDGVSTCHMLYLLLMSCPDELLGSLKFW